MNELTASAQIRLQRWRVKSYRPSKPTEQPNTPVQLPRWLTGLATTGAAYMAGGGTGWQYKVAHLPVAALLMQ